MTAAWSAGGPTDAPLREASDPTTAPARLLALVRSRRADVRDAVIANPNVPATAITRAAAGHPEALARNPLLVWLGVEDPDHLRRLAPAVRRRLLVVADRGALWWATRFGDDDDRLAALANPSLPSDAAGWLVEHGSPGVADAAGRHVALPARPDPTGPEAQPTVDSSILDQLLALDAAPHWLLPAAAAGAEPWLRRRAADHPACPPASLRALLLDDDAMVRAAARRHRNVPPEAARLVDAMATTDADEPVPIPTDDTTVAWLRASAIGQRWLAARPDLPEPVAVAMAASEHWRERQALAAGPAVTVDNALRLAVDNDVDVRATLAANPHCPPLLLAVLAGDDEARVVAALAGRGPAAADADTVSPAMLDRVAGAGGRGPLIAARHRAATADRLDVWAGSDDWRVRQVCAAHDASGVDTLRRLAADRDYDVRHAVATNPSFPLAEAEAMAADPHALVRAGVARRSPSGALLARFAAEHDALVLASVAANPATAPAIVASLAARPPEELPVAVALALATRPDAPPRVLLALAARRDRDVTVALARRADLPDDAWARLFDAEPSVARSVRIACRAPHELTPGAFAAALTAAPWALDLLDDRGPPLPATMLPVLGAHTDWHLRERAALHPACPVDLLTRLADDGDYDVRKAVAAHRSAPNGVVVRLAFDTNPAVRLAVARRADAPSALLAQLALDDTDDVRLAALGHPGCPPGIGERHRAVLDGRPVPPGELLDAAGGSQALRIAAAQHPDTPHGALARLAVDGDWKVREAVAGRTGLDGGTLTALAQDGDRDVRRAVAGNPSTPTAVLESLAADADDTVRRRAVTHPALPDRYRGEQLVRVLVQAARSPAVASRAAAAACPDTPRYLRRRRHFWQSTDWLVRYGVATNPATETDLLARLADDGHRMVRAAARARLEGAT